MDQNFGKELLVCLIWNKIPQPVEGRLYPVFNSYIILHMRETPYKNKSSTPEMGRVEKKRYRFVQISGLKIISSLVYTHFNTSSFQKETRSVTIFSLKCKTIEEKIFKVY